MFPRALIAAALLTAGAVSAQNYDVDADGDVDGDDWEALTPPTPDSEDFEQYPGEQAPQQAPTQQQFEQELSGYGAWYDEPGVGRVWQPSPNEVGADFVPYTTGGQWVSTTSGWQFASSYRFGTAPFHYGRWHRSPRYGWVWWPQYTWAPSWVDWRCNRAGNVAWAPLAPPGLSVGFTVGAPHWSFAYGRYHRPHMSSFSWGRYGGYRHGSGWGQRGGGYHRSAPVNRGWGGGGYGHHGGGGHRGGGRRH